MGYEAIRLTVEYQETRIQQRELLLHYPRPVTAAEEASTVAERWREGQTAQQDKDAGVAYTKL